MPDREDTGHELQRLQLALKSLMADIDEVKKRPCWSFQEDEEFRKIESAIGHFAYAVKSGNARL